MRLHSIIAGFQRYVSALERGRAAGLVFRSVPSTAQRCYPRSEEGSRCRSQPPPQLDPQNSDFPQHQLLQLLHTRILRR